MEVDGLFWHSYEMLVSKGADDAKNYHLKKTNTCKEHDYQLVHLFEDSLNSKFELCMDLIVSKLVLHGLKDRRKKIYARKCSVEEIDKKKAIKFFEENHIQGYGYGVNERIAKAIAAKTVEGTAKAFKFLREETVSQEYQKQWLAKR